MSVKKPVSTIKPASNTKTITSSPAEKRRTVSELDNQTSQKLISPSFATKKIIAGNGLRDSAQTLPFANQINKAFGRHRLDDLKVHLGNSSAIANQTLNSLAYTQGNHIAFGRAPDLRLAAHEAAHVVQQRSYAGPTTSHVGTPEDIYEQHADQVANAVVNGRSAEGLLDKFPRGDSRPSGNLQFQARERADTFRPASPGFRPRSYPQPEGAGSAAQGECILPAGILRWALAPRVGYVNARIEFIPNSQTAAANPTISYIQTVESNIFNREGAEVDVVESDTDPYYGAAWDEETESWVDEPRMGQRLDPDIDDLSAPREGSWPYTAETASAVLNDSPHVNTSETKYFETVVVVVETGEVLGSLSWNIQRWEAGIAPAWLNSILGWEQPTSTIVRNVSCNPGASPQFDAIVQRYYEDHPEAIRDSDGSAR